MLNPNQNIIFSVRKEIDLYQNNLLDDETPTHIISLLHPNYEFKNILLLIPVGFMLA